MNPPDSILALHLLPGLGPVRVQKLLEIYGTPEKILSASASQLRDIQGIGQELAQSIANWEEKVDVAAERKRLQQLGLQAISITEERYPTLLREIYDPPLLLTTLGEILPEDRHAIAMVGARRTSHYGRQAAHRLATELAARGMTIVSGMATGIDTVAHEAALAASGRTLAVIGSGLGQLSREQRKLADRIAQHGAVVSEFPVAFPASIKTFPQRNRLISGLSQGVVVVEAKTRSGSLITAHLATEQNRSVFAVPGPIDRPSSQGTNRLIQEGAALVMSAEDIFAEIAPPRASQKSATPAPAQTASTPEEAAILTALAEDPLPLDLLAEKTGFSPSTLSATLLKLELKSLVKALPGSYFQKK